MTDARVVVCAAVIERNACYLVTRRLAGTHLEGYWEFPGGKCNAGETHVACLIREIQEELGCEVLVAEELLQVVHEYGDRAVELHFFRGELTGEPQRLLGQEVRWVSRAELRTLEFPPADEQLIELLAG